MRSTYHHAGELSAANSARAYALELTGFNRHVLVLGDRDGRMSRALSEQHCDVTVADGEQLDGSELALPDRPFDAVLAVDALEHARDPGAVLRRAARLLAPGGQIVAALPHAGHADVRLAMMAGEWDVRSGALVAGDDVRLFALASIRTLVREAGLTITELRRVRVPVFESGLGVDPQNVAAEVLEVMLRDPEAETAAFVLAASPEIGENKLGRLTTRNAELELELERMRIECSAARAARELLLAENEDLREHARARELQITSMHATVDALRAELSAPNRMLAAGPAHERVAEHRAHEPAPGALEEGLPEPPVAEETSPEPVVAAEGLILKCR